MKNNCISFIIFFIKKYKITIIFSFLFCVLIPDIFDLFGKGLVLQTIIDRANNSVLTVAFAILSLLTYALLMCISNITNFLKKKINFGFEFKLKEDIRLYLFKNIIRQTNDYFSSNFTGTISNSVNLISNNVSLIIIKIFDIISNIFVYMISIILYYKKNNILSLSLIFWTIIYLTMYIYLSKYIKSKTDELISLENKYFGSIVDCFENLFSIKVFNQEKNEENNINIFSKNLLNKRKSVLNFSSLLDMFNFLSMSTIISVISVISAKLFFQNKISIGEVVFNIQLISSLFWWLKYAMQNYLDVIEIYSNIKQSFNILIKPINIINFKNSIDLICNHRNISFNNISFQYSQNLPLIFNNLNLYIPSNQKVGIVGYSGAGKSTLISLLLRLYDVNNGEILIDGYNIKTDITQESLRQNISYIPQDPILFHRTIKENIAYGKINATDEEIIEASKKANCYEFIMNLENKFETLVGERGVKLSGGQRQRIAIARAILKNSKILILDEATSALDSITEREIQEALKNLMKDKTVIAVAHRLSTLDNMDRIIVLDKGKIIQDGTKEELLKNKQGLFSKMWEMQKGGFIE